MFQRIFRAKSLQQIICVLLVTVMLVGLFPGSVLANPSIAPLSYTFTTPVGWVGPNNTFAPWGWDNDDPTTRTVVVGSGTVQANAGAGDEASMSPWNAWREGINTIVFTDPDHTIGSRNLTSLFRNLPTLTTIENIDFINITATPTVWMEHMFRDAVALENIYGLEKWDTNAVLRFSSMFRGTSFTTLNVSTFDMSSALRLDSMFRDTSNLATIIGLEEWNTSSVLWMLDMFSGASSLTELAGIEGWNTGNVQTIAAMFRGANSLTNLDLSNWDTSSIGTATGVPAAGMANAFREMGNLESLNLESWDTRHLTPAQMANMFTGTTTLGELKLGENWTAQGAPNQQGLVTPPGPRYTGSWINVGGNQHLIPAQLMTGTAGRGPAGTGDTWVWEEAFFDVEFHSGPNGTIAPGPVHEVTIRGGDTLPVGDIPIPTGSTLPAPGYEFAYWESSTGSTYTTEELLNLPITTNRTFTAIFVPSNAIQVTFVLNGGLYGGDPNNVYRYILPNDPITAANVPTPTRPNYNFLGWQESGTDPLLSCATVGTLIVTEPRTFVAYWEPILSERQLYLIGTEDGLIRPNANITRAEVATILFRLITDQARTTYWIQTNPYSDVELQNWFNNAISTMTNAGVFKGLPDGSFAPNQTITRAEMAVAIVRFMEEMDGMNLLGTHFTDISGHWAANYINAAAVNGWVQGPYGLDGAFYPDRPLTRAEAAAIINHTSGRLQEHTQDLLSNMQTWPDNTNVNAWYYFYIQSATNSYTFRWGGTNDAFEQWVALIPARNWAVLERPESGPGDILGYM